MSEPPMGLWFAHSNKGYVKYSHISYVKARLREILLQIVKTQEATLGRRDGYGQRYLIDFVMEWRGKRALVRSGWIIEHGTDTPRLTTCYPL